MRSDLTDITVVLDRSGSMESCKQDAEGGLNSFIEEQKKQPGSAIFTLMQFDTQYEFVHKGVDLQTVGRQVLKPRGSTALLDAVGRAINETGTRLGAMNEVDRPGLVLFVIVTDGQENSSKDFQLSKIREMIQLQQNVYKWKFTFLGADQDAFAEAGAMGIHLEAVANFEKAKAGKEFAAVTRQVSRMRGQAREGHTVDAAFTTSERQEIDED